MSNLFGLSDSQSFSALTSGISAIGGAAGQLGSAAADNAAGDADLTSAQADLTLQTGLTEQATSDTQEASLYGTNVSLAEEGTAEANAVNAIQSTQANRNLELTQGSAMAAASANGQTATGSVGNIIASNAKQGALAQQVYGLQSAEIEQSGAVTANSYTEQENSANEAAQNATTQAQVEGYNATAEQQNAQGEFSAAGAATAGGTAQAIGGIAGLALGLFNLF